MTEFRFILLFSLCVCALSLLSIYYSIFIWFPFHVFFFAVSPLSFPFRCQPFVGVTSYHRQQQQRQQDSDILSLRTGAVSWFEVNGYGCLPTYPTNITSEDPFRLVRPEYVEGCLLEWYTIETIQSVLQLSLAVNFAFSFRCNRKICENNFRVFLRMK